MSKAKLKKELQNMTKEQVIEMLLETYDVNRQFKEYFEYYINPDEEKLKEKTIDRLEKEATRIKRYHSKMRVTNIKSILKEMEAFHPGYDTVIDVYFRALKAVAGVEIRNYVTQTQSNLKFQLLERIVELADRNFVLDATLARLEETFKLSGPSYSYVIKELDTHLKQLLSDMAHDPKLYHKEK